MDKCIEDFCIYTCIMGNYESLNEQDVANNCDIDFICFTDNIHLQSKTWRIVYIDGIIIGDSSSSQRYIKILPEKWIQNYKYSLYIDNSVILKEIPYEIISNFVKSKLPIGISHHSFRESILDEFLAVSFLNYDLQSRFLEQLISYSNNYHDFLHSRLFWGGFILRDHQNVSLIDFEQKWYSHLLRFSNRDQISLALLIYSQMIEYFDINIDNNESVFHRWPIAENRMANKRPAHFSNEINYQEKIRHIVKELKSNKTFMPEKGSPSESKVVYNNVHTVDGANNLDAGGSVSFGIQEFPYALPMSSIKGELVNKIHTELQGALLISTRPLGEAGQPLIPRIRVNSNGTLQLIPLDEYPLSPKIGDIFLDKSTQQLLICLDGENWSKIMVESKI